MKLSSPCGDKLQWHPDQLPGRGTDRYRPLAGISCNSSSLASLMTCICYRPLAGISCNLADKGLISMYREKVIVPLRG